jgi:hypothetical protein
MIDDNRAGLNVTSPTGIRAITNLGGADITAPIWDKIEARHRDRDDVRDRDNDGYPLSLRAWTSIAASSDREALP